MGNCFSKEADKLALRSVRITSDSDNSTCSERASRSDVANVDKSTYNRSIDSEDWTKEFALHTSNHAIRDTCAYCDMSNRNTIFMTIIPLKEKFKSMKEWMLGQLLKAHGI